MDDILTLYENYLDFVPTYKMDIKEKMLSLVRLSIYLCLISLIIYPQLFVLFFIIGLIFYGIYKNIKNDNENKCVKPSIVNPAMNETYSDTLNNPLRKKACDYRDKNINDEYKKYLGYNLYENENEIFFFRNQERIFYTQPVTEIINDQDEYLKEVYKNVKGCKQDRFNCLPHEEQLNRIYKL
jgi:hypothetical protein